MDLEFEGIVNVRDLGGLPAAGGRTVRPARSAACAGRGWIRRATRTSAGSARRCTCATSWDFRDPDECARRPTARAGRGVSPAPALAVLPARPRRGTGRRPGFRRRLPGRLYTPISPTARRAPRLLRHVLPHPAPLRTAPVYWHCTQCKDRTGVAALLLLAALDTPEEAALTDYYASNAGLLPERARTEAQLGGRWPSGTLTRSFRSVLLPLRTGPAGAGGIVRRRAGLPARRLGLTDAALRTLRAFYLTEIAGRGIISDRSGHPL
jgi:protein-tyrosine phosphatase